MRTKRIDLRTIRTYPASKANLEMPNEKSTAPPFWGVGSYFNFGKYEMEHEAQVLINFSLLKKEWVGVHCGDLIFILRDRTFFIPLLYKILPECLGYKRKLPQIPESDTGIREFGFGGMEKSRFQGFPASIVTGLRMLEKDDWIAIKKINNADYLFPTAHLISYLEKRIEDGVLNRVMAA